MTRESRREMGGAQRSMLDLIRGLRQKYEISCLAYTDGCLSRELKGLGCRVIFCDVSWSRKTRHAIANYWRLNAVAAQLKAIAPDVLYSNGGFENIFAVKLARRLNSRLITHIRNFFPTTDRDTYQFAKSDVIIACSDFVAQTPRKFNRDVRVVHNGINADTFNPRVKSRRNTLRRQFGFQEEFLIGSIGNVQERKGYREFVDVAAEVVRKIPSSRFLIIGSESPDSEFTKDLKKKIRDLGLEEKIIFMGFITEIENIFAVLDIFLFPTRNEPFARSIIEATACKVPVVSCDSGGVPEIIENKKSGFLFQPGDVNGMARCVVDLLKDKAVADRVAENAYRNFVDRYTLDAVVSSVDRIIRDLLPEDQTLRASCIEAGRGGG